MSLESSSESSPQFYAESTDRTYDSSPFVPLLVLLIGLIGWSGFQSYTSYAEGAALRSDLKSAQGTIHQAEVYHSRLVSLAQDLVRTAQKDTFAAQVVKEANLQVRMNPDASQGSGR